jgi:hypothetical protein
MKPLRIEDLRFPKQITTSDRNWSLVLGWQKQGWVRVRPVDKHVVSAELTDAGLQVANQRRGDR